MKITKFSLFILLLIFGNTLAGQSVVLVNNLNDAGTGSLRNAVSIAFPDDTIRFSVTGTITLTSGSIDYAKDVYIDGPGRDLLIIDGDHTYQAFNATSGSTTIRNLTIQNCQQTHYDGGAIFWNGDSLKLLNVRLLDNGFDHPSSSANFDRGGALYATGLKIELDSCLLDSNYILHHRFVWGGAAYLQADTIIISNSDFLGNFLEHDALKWSPHHPSIWRCFVHRWGIAYVQFHRNWQYRPSNICRCFCTWWRYLFEWLMYQSCH